MRDRVFWWMKVRLALIQANVVLTVSDYAAAQISEHLGIPSDRIRVTLEGVSAAYRPSDSDAEIHGAAARVGVPHAARWLIYVGGFGPHKHLDVLVRAHAQVSSRRAEPLVLLLAGSEDDGFHQDVEGIRRTIRECGTEDLVRWVGYLPDEELRHLHTGALALVLVSASEGFGLPAVEAARCGCPVIVTTASPLPGVLDGGGLFVEPGSVSALVAALDRLLADEEARRAMGRRALERASALSWSRSAQAALDAVEDAASFRLRPAV
jgi:glycosyltransferase involved in cell wall biosynthesis